MSIWSESWTPEMVEQNYKVLGCVDHEEMVQLFEDAKLLRYLQVNLGNRDFNDMIGMAEEREEMNRDD